MSRKEYYYFLLFGLAAVVVYFLVCLLSTAGRMQYTSHYINVLVLFIFTYESFQAGFMLRILNLVLLMFSFAGFTFVIMHWPFGRAILLGPLFLICAGLLSNIFRSKDDRLIRSIILLVPCFHLFAVATNIYHWPLSRVRHILDIVVIGCVAVAILIRLLRDRRTKTS